MTNQVSNGKLITELAVANYSGKEGTSMPLTMANLGEPHSVKAIHGKDETRRFLESLGFVAGAEVTVVTEMGGNVILNIKDTRVAINKAMASRIMV